MLRLFASRPLLASSCSVGAASFVGDVVCQKIERQPIDASEDGASGSWDVLRSLRWLAFGSLCAGPVQSYWQRFLERKFPGGHARALASKLGASIVVMYPVMTVLSFTIVPVMQGDSGAVIADRLASKAPGAMAASMLYWPFVNLLAFRFVPVQYRPAAMGFGAAGWNVYLSGRVSAERRTSQAQHAIS